MANPYRSGGRSRLFYYYAFYVLVIVSVLVVTTAINTRILRESTYEVTRSDLHALAATLRNVIPEDALGSGPAAQAFCEAVAPGTGTRITIIRPDGKVLGDSAEDPAVMENHRGRPEIRAALDGREGVSLRYSDTVEDTLMYAALPILREGEVAAVLRASLPVADVEALLGALYRRIAVATVILLLAALAATLLISRSLRRPLRDLHEGAGRLSAGDLEHRIPVHGPRELRDLEVALNSMARQLGTRLRELEGQRRETDEVLNTIKEPLIVADNELRLQRVNLAAARLAAAAARPLLGRPLLEVFRNAELHSIARDLAAGGHPEERDIVYYGPQEVQLQIWGVRLDSPGSVLHGSVLLLMRDVTQERRIDQMRRDFVANVSHELKTPLTMIRGAVETLQEMPTDGGEGRHRFQHMIAANVNRMEQMIEDLLSLARIERSESEAPATQGTLVDELFAESVEVAVSQFGHDRSRMVTECPKDLTADVHPALMIQALVNLLDNALTYSERDKTVQLTAKREDNAVVVTVADEGWGIPLRHQDRVFERFYRVDQSRSRESGGTGLGLSIVRHIVALHGGSVTLDSRPGEGSTFTIHLPGGAA